VQIYRSATQLTGVIAIPVTLVLALFAEQILWIWTGDRNVASRTAPIVSLYALGNGMLALAALPYYLQFAKGDIKLHLIGHAIFVVMLIPTLIWATFNWGMIGAGYAWLGATSAYFVLWVPQIHRRFFKGLHTRWLRDDLGVTTLLTTLGAIAARHFSTAPEGRVMAAIETCAIGLVLLTLAAVGSSWVRDKLRQQYILWTTVKA
jgi:O-antigen/teichoic acid export membrane protein